nr:hypothetical protein [Tanacetum cinerariifolium]
MHSTTTTTTTTYYTSSHQSIYGSDEICCTIYIYSITTIEDTTDRDTTAVTDALPIPLPTSSFPLPLLLLSISGSESMPEADIPLRKKAHFTTLTGEYEVGESSVAAAARKIRPALTIDDSRRAEDRLIGRLRRERQYFRTLSTTYAKEVAHSRDYCTQIMDYCQSQKVHTSTLVTQIEAL